MLIKMYFKDCGRDFTFLELRVAKGQHRPEILADRLVFFGFVFGCTVAIAVRSFRVSVNHDGTALSDLPSGSRSQATQSAIKQPPGGVEAVAFLKGLDELDGPAALSGRVAVPPVVVHMERSVSFLRVER